MELNKGTMKKLFFLVAFGVTLAWLLGNIDGALGYATYFFGLIAPFVIGSAIAFIINVPMRGIEKICFENKYAKKHKALEKIKRPVSMVLTFLLVAFIIFIVLFLLIPELGRTIMTIQRMLPKFYKNLQSWSEPLMEYMPTVNNFIENLNFDWHKITASIIDFFKNGATGFFSSTFNIATSVFNGIFNFILGIIFAIYILSQKEKLSSQFTRLIKAFIPEKKSDFILKVCKMANQIFSKFITGQCAEALILGILFFIVLTIFRLPYALLISVLITVTALIPIFGAFIGCAVGAFLILVANPMQAVWFVIIFLVLQQLEGNLIYPKVVGNSVGLPSIWVLVAVTIGGSTMGVLGMLVGVPTVSLIYSLLREIVAKRNENKKATNIKTEIIENEDVKTKK